MDPIFNEQLIFACMPYQDAPGVMMQAVVRFMRLRSRISQRVLDQAMAAALEVVPLPFQDEVQFSTSISFHLSCQMYVFNLCTGFR
jgi:hypothetical protein